jgi:hypothetical protein
VGNKSLGAHSRGNIAYEKPRKSLPWAWCTGPFSNKKTPGNPGGLLEFALPGAGVFALLVVAIFQITYGNIEFEAGSPLNIKLKGAAGPILNRDMRLTCPTLGGTRPNLAAVCAPDLIDPVAVNLLRTERQPSSN